MESLSFKRVDIFLFSIFGVLIILPILKTLSELLLVFELTFLNAVFFKLLLRALAVTIAQALASAVLVCAVGFAIGLVLAFQEGRIARWASRLTHFFGFFMFAMPSLAISLVILQIYFFVFRSSGTGFWLIVFANGLFNFLMVASSLELRIRSWRKSGGDVFIESGKILGAPALDVIRLALGPLLKSEFRMWFPLLFVWSASAFVTILVLGGGPQFANLEVLLFYSLQNDFGSARLLVLFLSQLLVGAATLYLTKKVKAPNSLSFAGASNLELTKLLKVPLSLKVFSILLWALITIFPLLMLFSPLSSLFSIDWQAASIKAAILTTLFISVASGVLSFVLCLLLSMASSRLRLVFVYSVGLSSVVVAASWLSVGFDAWLGEGALYQMLVVALGIVFTQLAFVSHSIQERLQSIPLDQIEAAQLSGASRFTLWSHFVYPASKDLFIRFAVLGFVFGIGEFLFSSLFLSGESLATLSKRMANRYDFSLSQSVVVFSALTLLALSFFEFLYSRSKGTSRA